MRDILERFESKFKKSKGCWEWKAGKHSSFGYGHFHFSKIRGKVKAHRASWIFYRGEIPEGMCILHKCDNPPCVNPEHLFIGTRADNNRDMKEKGRGRGLKGEKHSLSKLKKEDILKIRKFSSEGVLDTAIAKMFGVKPGCIWFFTKRKTWKHI